MTGFYAPVMTVTEHFGFDMLSAPVLTVDRRALSQAWYSALYATRNAAQAPRRRTVANRSTPPGSSPGAPASGDLGNGAASRIPTLARYSGESFTIGTEAMERRAPRSPLARSIERVLARSSHLPRRASFTLGGSDGRVHVVIQAIGANVRVIAFCTPRARARVAAALRHVRCDLVFRGFDVHATLGESS